MIEVKQGVMIPVDLLDIRDDNPQEMSDSKFNMLVEKIKDEGFIDPLRVTPKEDGRYEIYAGYHRLKAAKVLGMTELPCIVRDIDEDRKKFEMVKDNVVKGNLDPMKFTKLFNSLSDHWGREVAREMFALTPDEFEKYYKEVKRSLPPEMQEKLENAKKEIKNIEDLSTILNKLFNEYGDTLEQNFMIFDFGGKENLWIKCDKELWEEVSGLAKRCAEAKMDINEEIKKLFIS